MERGRLAGTEEVGKIPIGTFPVLQASVFRRIGLEASDLRQSRRHQPMVSLLACRHGADVENLDGRDLASQKFSWVRLRRHFDNRYGNSDFDSRYLGVPSSRGDQAVARFDIGLLGLDVRLADGATVVVILLPGECAECRAAGP